MGFAGFALGKGRPRLCNVLRNDCAFVSETTKKAGASRAPAGNCHFQKSICALYQR